MAMRTEKGVFKGKLKFASCCEDRLQTKGKAHCRLWRTVRSNNRPFPFEIRARMNHNCDQPAAAGAANMSANEPAWPERLP